ncbi:MarR family transcriptional regulator [Halobaculum sp. CBA1158]|uniref:MarR family transcriptional regulator n=1 Tax=Halobaculum sp. CBA1158 TaxID=2904243 RepID=UPI001F416FD0|nr:MarR family transcriptional regulator [Halobaculum sp. CBA1158]UIO98913.1 MarR family transcriptional regulator [Halobaculum sp. CBA1158]
MGVSTANVLTPEDLNQTDGAVIDVLHDGRVTPQYVADEIEVSRTYASERLKRLVEHGHVAKVAPGLYELVDDPRGDSTATTDEPDREALREQYRRLVDALERVDRDAVDDAVEHMGEILEVDDVE